MPRKESLKSRILDEKDIKILMILQKNGRESLTSIAKQVHLSIDSINARIKEMQNKGIFQFGIFIDPRKIGFSIVTDIKIKLHNITTEEKEEFIKYLIKHPRTIDVISIMGDYDLTCVIIAKDTKELDKMSTKIREKYSKIIADWKPMLIMETIKFEYYDLEQPFEA